MYIHIERVNDLFLGTDFVRKLKSIRIIYRKLQSSGGSRGGGPSARAPHFAPAKKKNRREM